MNVGTRVVALKEITEGGLVGDESATYPHPRYIHAIDGDEGTVEAVKRDGFMTVRFDRTGTATIVAYHEIRVL